jgi:multiple sugar transport system substrate-binding protein
MESTVLKYRNRVVGVALLCALATAASACASGGSSPAPSSPQAAGSSGSCQSQTGKVNITYWAWNTQFKPAVAEFNATHPNIHVTFDLVAEQDYQNLFNALKAGNAPDVAQVEYSELPAFRFQNGLTNIASCAPVKDMSSQFPAWTMSQVGVGTSAVYGVPQDIEPLGLYYREDIFKKYGLQVPTTWAQYQADALKLKSENPAIKITSMTDGDEGILVGLDWQNGARPFQYSGSSFMFDMDSPQAAQVANYWQGLVKDGVINTTAKPFTPAQYSAWDNGTVATVVAPAFYGNVMVDDATASKGDWRVAPLPQWQAGQDANGNDGGSSIAVMAGTKHEYADAVFAEWLGANQQALETAFGGVELAAASSYMNSSAIDTPSAYFGGQPYLQVFKAAAAGVNTNFQWAPNQFTVNLDLQDALAGAFNGTSSIESAFKSTQSQAAASLRSSGVTVLTK